jgi:hypothetical protein
MDEIISFYPFRSGSLFHGHNFDIIAVKNVTHHGILVAFAGSYRKFPGEICIELSLVDHNCIKKDEFWFTNQRV